MSLPRFVAVPAEPHWDQQAAIIDLKGPAIEKNGQARNPVICQCHDIETAELIALALNREMMQ